MEQIAKTLSEFKKLDKIEIEQVLLQLLIDGDLQFQDIVVSYVHYLEKLENERSVQVTGLASSLSMWWSKNWRDKDLRKNKTAYHLLKSGVFHTAEIEKELIKTIEESGYSEDEFGFPVRKESE